MHLLNLLVIILTHYSVLLYGDMMPTSITLYELRSLRQTT